MVAEILGVVKLAPVATLAPPVAPVYHIAVPIAQVAPKVTVPVPQIASPLTDGAVGIAFIVALTSVLPDSQPADDLQLT